MKEQLDLTRLPQHIAIIMDGNGRWAQQNGMDRYRGHEEGVVPVRKTVEAAGEIGVRYLTLYAFSTENWKRPQVEIDALMTLLVNAIRRETPDLMKNNVRLLTIGDIDRLPRETKENLRRCIEETGRNTGLTLILALSYSARREITEAMRQIASEVREGHLDIQTINEETIACHLETKHIPDPDLLIRTGGEYRISNFLLWQAAYAELYFTPVYWPEFRENNLYEAILDFQKRERRFGKTGEQVKLNN
jgi:undecaprenyl diphosphate synthase